MKRILLLLLVSLVFSSSAIAAPPALPSNVTAAAYELAGRQFTIRCDLSDKAGAWGQSWYFRRIIKMQPVLCQRIRELMTTREITSERAHALAVLVHESIHQVGPPYSFTQAQLAQMRECSKRNRAPWSDPCPDPAPDIEILTECRSLQTLEGFAIRIGFTQEESSRIVALYLPQYRELPHFKSIFGRAYRSPKRCHDGGELDIHPGIGNWPSG